MPADDFTRPSSRFCAWKLTTATCRSPRWRIKNSPIRPSVIASRLMETESDAGSFLIMEIGCNRIPRVEDVQTAPLPYPLTTSTLQGAWCKIKRDTLPIKNLAIALRPLSPTTIRELWFRAAKSINP
jgi:hypothetical protein